VRLDNVRRTAPHKPSQFPNNPWVKAKALFNHVNLDSFGARRLDERIRRIIQFLPLLAIVV